MKNNRILVIVAMAASVVFGSASMSLADSSSDTHLEHLQDRLRNETQPSPGAPTSGELNAVKMPSVVLHTEFVVETNKRGQVVRVRSGKMSKDSVFNAQTYGNSLQAFIRTPDGHSDAGIFRLTYDYSPTTHLVKRGVEIVQKGGVNPNAESAVDAMAHARPASSAAPKQK